VHAANCSFNSQTGADYFGLVSTTEDFRSGTEAFLKKQKPIDYGK